VAALLFDQSRDGGETMRKIFWALIIGGAMYVGRYHAPAGAHRALSV
jgi:hypothetical protein